MSIPSSPEIFKDLKLPDIFKGPRKGSLSSVTLASRIGSKRVTAFRNSQDILRRLTESGKFKDIQRTPLKIDSKLKDDLMDLFDTRLDIVQLQKFKFKGGPVIIPLKPIKPPKQPPPKPPKAPKKLKVRLFPLLKKKRKKKPKKKVKKSKAFTSEVQIPGLDRVFTQLTKAGGVGRF